MITRAVLTNTDAGIACDSVASAILIGETIDLLPLTVLNCFLHMPHGFCQFLLFPYVPNTFDVMCTESVSAFFRIKLIIQLNLTVTTLSVIFVPRRYRVYKMSL
jgi:hypothetical protein